MNLFRETNFSVSGANGNDRGNKVVVVLRQVYYVRFLPTRSSSSTFR